MLSRKSPSMSASISTSKASGLASIHGESGDSKNKAGLTCLYTRPIIKKVKTKSSVLII